MNERILLTGSSGFLGHYLIKHLAGKADLHCLYKRNKPQHERIFTHVCDITNWDELSGLIDTISPSILIHTASLSDVERCELEKDLAYRINVLSTEYLSEIAGKRGIRFIYISTDNVFDGKKGWYREEDHPHPINYYGETKLMGEEKVRSFCRRWLILRLSHLYGKGFGLKKIFFEEIMERGRRGEPVSIYREFRTFLWVEDCAAMIRELVFKRDVEGVLHLAGKDRMSRYEFARRVFSHFGFDESLLREVDINESSASVRRPIDVSLVGDKGWMLSGIEPHGLEESLSIIGKDI